MDNYIYISKKWHFLYCCKLSADKIRGNVGTILVIIDSVVIIVVFHYCVNSGLSDNFHIFAVEDRLERSKWV